MTEDQNIDVADIVILEPDDDSRIKIVAQLEAMGHKVHSVQNQEQAESLPKELHPGVIFCYFQTHNIYNQQILRMWTDMWPDVTVVALAEEPSTQDAVEAMRQGAIDYLSKPIDQEVLKLAVSRALERSRLLAQNQHYQEQLELANRHLKKHLSELQIDQQAGRSVQLSMLPPSPMVVGPYRLTHQIAPSLLLSGDFVDYFHINNNYLLFYLADVSGHGAGSAFVTVLLKNFSRRFRREHGFYMLDNPSEALNWLNSRLLEYNLSRHVALFLGVIDISSRQLRYANAGQFPNPVLASPEDCKILELPGPPLGLFENPQYDFGHVDLPESFVLAMFTDGVLEIMQDERLSEKEQRLVAMTKQMPSNIDDIWKILGVDAAMSSRSAEDGFPDDVCCFLLTNVTAGAQ